MAKSLSDTLTKPLKLKQHQSSKMLHSAAPTSFNMFPFSQHPQHPTPGHHGEMFHPTANTHHHNHHSSQHHQQQQQEPPQRPRFLFKMPRVVPNQKEKFESDEFMKRHSREAEVSIIMSLTNDINITLCNRCLPSMIKYQIC